MCHCAQSKLVFLLVTLCLCVSLSYSKTEIGEDVRRGLDNKCHDSGGCPEAAEDGVVAEEQEQQSVVSDPALQGIHDKSEGRRRRRKKTQYLLLATAVIAAKAAAIATAASIMIPLALKALAILATKAILIGKLALIVVSIVGFLRMAQQSSEMKTTEILLEPPHHRADLPLPLKRNRLRAKPHEGWPPAIDDLRQ